MRTAWLQGETPVSKTERNTNYLPPPQQIALLGCILDDFPKVVSLGLKTKYLSLCDSGVSFPKPDTLTPGSVRAHVCDCPRLCDLVLTSHA